MGRANIRCYAAGQPRPGRRFMLLAAVGMAALPAARAGAALRQVSLADLVTADGSASGLARSLASSQVSVRGYLAPSLDGREFALTEQPAAPCQLCGASHDAGASLTVFTALPDPGAPMLQLIQVSGRLEVDDAPGHVVRLAAAQIQSV